MRRRITLKPSEEYAFDISRNALVLVLREATQNVVLKGDSLTPIELSRSDILDIQLFRNKRMFLANEGSAPITVEFQLSDTPISIREQRMAVEGGVTVSEIATPVVVSSVQAPVRIAGTVPVSFDEGVSVKNWPQVQAVSGRVVVDNLPSVQAVEVGNFPAVQAVEIGNFPAVQAVKTEAISYITSHALEVTLEGEYRIPANPRRESLIVQAHYLNMEALLVNGFQVLAGGSMVLPTSGEVLINGENGDIAFWAEVTRQ
ncbi:hypothetical protein K6N94_003205 [Vibrio cholerae]|nr:hypothetical protein [Vibrio cholerae]EHZ6902513.1 hypothetical protein [Vibrio cholerae]EJK2104159.1 hypothetical protein [Vibrio cholerae]EJL6646447.1 hypothetical protein [Vibrio cholerae]